MRRLLSVGAVGALLIGMGAQANAGPCGPAVLSSVSGQVLINRGAGFLTGAAGMPLAIGDYVMVRGGSADILYVNGTGSSLKGAASTAIVACSVDGASLTSPALAQASAGGGTGNFGTGSTTTAITPATATPTARLAPGLLPSAVDSSAMVALGVGSVAVIGGVIAATTSSNDSTPIRTLSP